MANRFALGGSHVDDSALQSDCYRVGAVVGAKLAHDTFHVGLDRVLRKAELIGNEPIGVARGNTPKHFEFAS